MCCPKERNISLRWSEAVLLGSWFYKHFVPPGLKTESLFGLSPVKTG